MCEKMREKANSDKFREANKAFKLDTDQQKNKINSEKIIL